MLKNGNLVSEVMNEYKSVNVINYQNISGYVYKKDKVLKSKGNNALYEILHFYYDQDGNLYRLTENQNKENFYLWGYNGKYLIAHIVNSSEQELNTLLGGNSFSDFDESDSSSINALRNSLPNASIRTYTYLPLIGLQKVIDPQGRATTYFYDNLNRLDKIEDDNGKIIEDYIYNYKN